MATKILVVDDELEIVKVVRAYLERGGFAVVTAREGREALAVFRPERPQLTILRRAEGTPHRAEVISASNVTVDLLRHTATVNGKPLDLTTMEFNLLARLVEHPGQVFT